jgi:hypothetical protein
MVQIRIFSGEKKEMGMKKSVFPPIALAISGEKAMKK